MKEDRREEKRRENMCWNS